MFELLQTSHFVALITLVDSLYAIKQVLASCDKRSFAPGPPRWPIVGNALQIPQKSGTALIPNLCSTAITEADGPLSREEEDLLVWAAATVMGGGLDTNMSTVPTFFLVMTLYPKIQAKARAEIDSVIGLDRLPSISDKPLLPYCRSLITELYRWAPAAPLCLPHSVTQDDVYNGMHMLHDPEVFADPLAFNPDRYGNSDAEMRKFAEGTIFAIVATTLATCEVVPAVDAHGNDIVPDVGYTTGTIASPEPFKCTLRSRSPQAAAMLAQTSIVPE
ncbi:cytochrome P450 [Amylocystis lapponica]|nr:cytochrome P450 [Amylocystis lapponica]